MAPEFSFAPATKEQEKARISLEGPSGSGKTWTALEIAAALGGRTAVIDTERGSASKYASDFDFDVCKMNTYDPGDLAKVLAVAAAGGYDTAIVDSFSHFWMGAGGMLEVVDGFAKRNPGPFGGWKDARPLERQMIDGLLAFPGHLIVTMRTKTDWVITENRDGKKEPKKIGLKAEQRDGIEYEFDLVGTLDLDHNLIIQKSRIRGLADQVINRPGGDLGRQILDWLSDGKPQPTVADYLAQLEAATTREQLQELWRTVSARRLLAAPCLDPDGEPTTLAQLIHARGARLAPGAPVAPAAQPQPEPPAGQLHRSKGPVAGDPWATGAEAPITPPPAAAPAPASPAAVAPAAPEKPWTRDQAEQLIVDLIADIGSAVTEEELGQLAASAEDAYKAHKISKRERDEVNGIYVGRMTEIRGAAVHA
jgi:hypothetical protein